MPVIETAPVTPAVPVVPIPDNVTVVACAVRLVSGLVPPIRPSKAMLPEVAATESASPPSTVLLKATLLPTEVRVALAPSVTGPS